MLSSPLHRERDGGFWGFRLSWDQGRSGPLPVAGPQPLAGDWAFLPMLSSPLHQPHSALLDGQRGGSFCCFPETTECGGCVRLSWDQGRSGPLPVAGPQPLGGSWTYFRILLRILLWILSFPLPLPYATLLWKRLDGQRGRGFWGFRLSSHQGLIGPLGLLLGHDADEVCPVGQLNTHRSVSR